jgi:hypothetical protein
MEPPVSALLFSALLFLGMLLLHEVGRRVALGGRRREPDRDVGGLDTIEAAVFALFGLMIAFTFSGAATRFQEKRMLIAEEANDIGTAYLRVDLVPREAQPALRELFRQYLDSRLETYRRLPDMKAAAIEMAKSKQLQDRIWAGAVAATTAPGSPPSTSLLLLPALNSMIDITTTRTMSLQNHPPRIIHWLLFALGLLCSLLAGYRLSSHPRRDWPHILGFTIFTVIVVYVMLDIEYPRAGLIRLAGADQVLVELRQSMK